MWWRWRACNVSARIGCEELVERKYIVQIAVVIVSIGLAIFMAVAGFLNVFFVGDAKKNQAHLQISIGLTRFIGWCQWASVVGLIGGLWWRPIGIAATIG